MPAWWSKRSRMGQAVGPSLSSLRNSSMERLAVIIVERLSPRHMIVSRRTSPLGPNLRSFNIKGQQAKVLTSRWDQVQKRYIQEPEKRIVSHLNHAGN